MKWQRLKRWSRNETWRARRTCIERAVLLCEDQAIHGYHRPPTLQTAKETGTRPSQSLKDAVERFEKEMLIEALKNSFGNMRKAALGLKTTERVFGCKVQKYGIDSKRYR